MQHGQASDQRIVWPPGHGPATAIVFAHNAIDIAAAPERVWSLLIDCVCWPSWYKHCADVTLLRGGPVLAPDGKFRFRTLGFTFEPEVTNFTPNQDLAWTAKGPAGTGGAHAWHIAPTPTGCQVITEEAQRGLVLRLRRSHLQHRLLAAHEDWLKSLKQRAES